MAWHIAKLRWVRIDHLDYYWKLLKIKLDELDCQIGKEDWLRFDWRIFQKAQTIRCIIICLSKSIFLHSKKVQPDVDLLLKLILTLFLIVPVDQNTSNDLHNNLQWLVKDLCYFKYWFVAVLLVEILSKIERLAFGKDFWVLNF